MEYTGKVKMFTYNGRLLRLYNQSSREWKHPYATESSSGETLHTSGCGIFAIAHLIDYCCCSKIDVESLADFAVFNGARTEDGTDRPTLLEAMEKSGRLSPYQLRYNFDGLRNDNDTLWTTLLNSGAALCDLRIGHIVAVVDWRIVDGEKQVLVIDSSRDSIHKDVVSSVRECVNGSEIISEFISEAGVHTGMSRHFSMYWVPHTKPFDFTLLQHIEI